jgi:hypothetical protein
LKAESKLWQKLKKNTPNIIWTRIESWGSFGFPDLVGYIFATTHDQSTPILYPGSAIKELAACGLALEACRLPLAAWSELERLLLEA